VCINCGNGYYINNYGQCRANPINCQFSNQYGVCLQCIGGYALQTNGVCSQQIASCLNYTTQNGQYICSSCMIGYYLKDPYTCLMLPNGCSQANSSGYCLQCYSGYSLNQNGICYTVVSNCKTYQLSTGICLECIPNYYLNINQTCQCIQCSQGYVLIQGACFATLPFCTNYSTTIYACLQCASGYYLYNNTCYQMPYACLSMNGSQCASCMQGYQIYNGLCQLINNSTCIQYNLITGICLQCKAGYYLAANSLCVLLPNSCTQANGQGVCLSCLAGYTLSNGICYKQVPNCLNWNGNTCQQCVAQYYLQNGICYKYPDNCVNFNATSLICIQCASGYQMYQGNCVAYTNFNCLYYNPTSQNQCYTCQASFYESWIDPTTDQIITSVMTIENFCLPLPQFCTNVDLLGNCISCSFGSTLSNNQCIGNNNRSINCQVFDPVGMKCTTCMIGYTFC
jgi:hypothetical protein